LLVLIKNVMITPQHMGSLVILGHGDGRSNIFQDISVILRLMR